MAEPNESGAAADQQITVAQLAAQLGKKASPDGGTGAAGTTSDPGARPAEETPAGGTPGTEPDLFQSATTDDGTAAAAPGEGGESDTEPAAPEWYQKRIAKFTAKQKEMEERLLAAERRAEEAAAEVDRTRRQANGKPKAWNHQEQHLQQQLGQKREVLRWAEENPEGATLTDEKGNEVSYTPDQVRAIKLSALEDIGDLRGQLREHQAGLSQSREHWDAEAVKAYPDLKDPNSETSRNVETMLEKLPWLREVPDARISLADMLAGRKARLKGGGATSQSAAPKAAPRAPATPGSAPARRAEGEPSEEVKAAQQTFQETGRVNDLARRFAAERKL